MEKNLQFEPVITDEQMALYDDLKDSLIRMTHHFNRCMALELLNKEWFAKELADRLYRNGYRKASV